MPPVRYSFAKAKDILSDNDKNRLAAFALVHIDHIGKADWNAVSAELGAASGNSAATMQYTLLKKLRDKGAVHREDDGATPPVTPDATAGGGTSSGKKRKTPAKKAKDGGDEGGSPVKKARKPKAKKADTPMSLKSEAGDEGSILNSTEASTIVVGGQGEQSASLFDLDGGEMQYPD